LSSVALERNEIKIKKKGAEKVDHVDVTDDSEMDKPSLKLYELE
jgi:hypothetical protein